MIPGGEHPFPLSGAVAFAGSRSGSPFPVAPVVSAPSSPPAAACASAAPPACMPPSARPAPRRWPSAPLRSPALPAPAWPLTPAPWSPSPAPCASCRPPATLPSAPAPPRPSGAPSPRACPPGARALLLGPPCPPPGRPCAWRGSPAGPDCPRTASSSGPRLACSPGLVWAEGEASRPLPNPPLGDERPHRDRAVVSPTQPGPKFYGLGRQVPWPVGKVASKDRRRWWRDRYFDEPLDPRPWYRLYTWSQRWETRGHRS